MKLNVKTELSSYDIIIERNQNQKIGEVISYNLNEKRNDIRKVFIITDNQVDFLYSRDVEESLKKENFEVFKYVLNSSLEKKNEELKNIETVMEIYSRLSEANIKRCDIIISLGGGVVGDIAGFVASTYLRGIGYVQIPTTLLSQVDSSVGGKTGIDIKEGKNLIGSFYNPLLVIIDPDYLKTLNLREYSSGMAEVIKYALIKDSYLINILKQLSINKKNSVCHDKKCCIDIFENNDNEKVTLTTKKNSNVDTDFIDKKNLHLETCEKYIFDKYDLLEQLIYKCCSIKKEFVENDQLDTGNRMILNFGHTIGHALESRYDYKKYLHGEAVGIGMYAITKKFFQKGYIKDEIILDLIKELLECFNLDFNYDCGDEELIKYILKDKKSISDSFRVVIVRKIGDAEILNVDIDFFK